jgi:hypothetical protein
MKDDVTLVVQLQIKAPRHHFVHATTGDPIDPATMVKNELTAHLDSIDLSVVRLAVFEVNKKVIA